MYYTLSTMDADRYSMRCEYRFVNYVSAIVAARCGKQREREIIKQTIDKHRLPFYPLTNAWGVTVICTASLSNDMDFCFCSSAISTGINLHCAVCTYRSTNTNSDIAEQMQCYILFRNLTKKTHKSNHHFTNVQY